MCICGRPGCVRKSHQGIDAFSPWPPLKGSLCVFVYLCTCICVFVFVAGLVVQEEASRKLIPSPESPLKGSLCFSASPEYYETEILHLKYWIYILLKYLHFPEVKIVTQLITLQALLYLPSITDCRMKLICKSSLLLSAMTISLEYFYSFWTWSLRSKFKL